MEYFIYEQQKHLLSGLTEPSLFVKSYNGVVDELNALEAKYNIELGQCIRVEKGRHGVAFRITEAVKAAGLNAGNLIVDIFISMQKNYLSPLEFVFVEQEPDEVYKFINENTVVAGDELSPGPRIMKASLAEIPLSKPYYQSLEDLKNYDETFLELRRANYQWCETISQDKHIIKPKDFVITTAEGDEDGLNGLLLMHSISGDRGRRHFTGIHHIALPIPPFVHDFIVVAPPDANGVYIATFKIEKRNGRIISKKEPSTMFPSHWTVQQFYLECYHAIRNKESIEGSATHFRSVTESGIPVEMHFSREGRFRTMYPIYTTQD